MTRVIRRIASAGRKVLVAAAAVGITATGVVALMPAPAAQAAICSWTINRDYAHISTSNPSLPRSAQGHTWLASTNCYGRDIDLTNQVQRQDSFLGIKYWSNVDTRGTKTETLAYGNKDNHTAIGHYNCSGTAPKVFRTFISGTAEHAWWESVVPAEGYTAAQQPPGGCS